MGSQGCWGKGARGAGGIGQEVIAATAGATGSGDGGGRSGGGSGGGGGGVGTDSTNKIYL